MALPRIDTPTYQLTLPSTQEKVDYRPFLVKEQKIIMMAQESSDETQTIRAMTDLLTSCTFGKIDTKRSPTFDIEYVFLKIRAKSVGETVNINIVCPEDGQTQVPVKINLDEIELLTGADHRTDIKLTDNITINFRYPIMSDLQGGKSSEVSDQSFKLLNKCVNSIHSGDDVYNRVDMTDKEVDDFIEQMNNKQFEDVGGEYK